jgi:hypothetical protein
MHWVQKGNPLKKILIDWAETLGRRHFLFLSNNQPKDSVRDGGGYRGGCGPAVERVGGRFIIVWDDGISDKTNKILFFHGLKWPSNGR